MEFITSGNLSYFQSQGERFVQSFLAHVDPAVSLRIYGECSAEKVNPLAYLPQGLAGGRISFVDLFTATPLRVFLEAARPMIERRIGPVSTNPKERLKSKLYDYRFDALTFCRKTLAICHAIRSSSARLAVWTDLDIVFHRRLDAGFLESLFGGKDIFYFGRRSQHSETGVLGFNTASKGVQDLAELMERCVVSMSFAKLSGWTDCHIFDHVRSALTREGRLSAVDLSKDQDGHVIARSCLAPYLDHLKGPRKYAGSSPERNDYLKRRGS